MTSLAPIIMLGFLLGVRHAADADHVVAISTIVSRGRTAGRALAVGVLWGLGHMLTVTAVGAAIILFDAAISPLVGLSMDLSVGVMLIVLGLSNLSGTTQWVTAVLTASSDSRPALHIHPHAHGDYVHSHPHGHDPESHGHREDDTPPARLDRMFGDLGMYQTIRPIVVGVVHGLAGSAAIVLMILATIRDPLSAIAYLIVFGMGTIAGMMMITLAIALPLVYAQRRLDRFANYLAIGCGFLSVAFGLLVVYRVGITDGLFAAHPNWIPQ
jgi:high-affinity nickel-transport protein